MLVDMLTRALLTLFALAAAASAAIIPDVRAAIAKGDFAGGERLIHEYRRANGVTPEMLEALSWLGRGALANKDYDAADRYAAETRKLALAELKKRPLDSERYLPIALGASIEVQGHVMAGRGERDRAVEFLRQELATYRDTSIRTRIQKNIHLLSLEGKPAPTLDTAEWLGNKPPKLTSLNGKPVLLFFWAHWCGDCKYQAPILARLQSENKDLVIVGPTQRYGYVARGEDASPDQEVKYIDQVRTGHYAQIPNMVVPVSQENFKNWGCSTTPTLALIGRDGKVAMYHPGKMPYEELAPKVAAVVGR